MRWSALSVERLRWGLLAGALLLVGVLVVLLSYGRYRAVKAWKQIVARSGATITHEADEVTYSQSLGGKKIFLLHAKHAVPHGEGRYTLEDGMLLLYDAKGQPADRIYGANFDYDEKTGVAKALGEVNMDLELPKALSARRSGGAADESAADVAAAQVVHVRTSGLTYVKKLGVAATDQEVEIAYGGMRGWAKGAEFDTGHSVVHLLADVRAEAQLHGANETQGGPKTQGGAQVTLNAAKADLDRDAEVIDLTAPRVESGGKVATADNAVLHLRKDGSLETVEARGAVTLKQGTRTISAPSLHAAMNQDSQVEHAELAGGVALVDTSAVRPMKGTARTVRIACDGAGTPTSLVAEGGATLSAEQPSQGGTAMLLGRQMGADRMTLTLVKANHGTRVSAVHAQGNAWATGDTLQRGTNGRAAGVTAAGVKTAGVKLAGVKTAGIKTMRITADDLRLAMVRDAAGKDEPQSLSGTGHTRIEQHIPDGTVQISSGDSLQATFAEAKGGSGVEIASAVQTGHVEMHSAPGKTDQQPSEGMAESVSLDAASGVMTLTSPQPASRPGTTVGHARLTQGDTSVSAETIRLMQATGDAVAEGDVAATFVNAKAGAAEPAKRSGGGAEAPVTHVLAQQATLRKAAQTVEFTGTDARPVRMWQGANQVEAANVLLDRAQDSMQAWPASAGGVVRAVFASEGAATAGRNSAGASKGQHGRVTAKGDQVVRVTSARMSYSGVSREAVFSGGVVAQAEDGQVRAQRGVAFLSQAPGSKGQGPGAKGQAGKSAPNPVAASVERIVMSGAVKVEQPGRVATGDQLLYTAATQEFVLTGTPGHPPHVLDDKQGSITGATLLFHSPDSTIVVAGEAAGAPGSHRVHTETTIKK